MEQKRLCNYEHWHKSNHDIIQNLEKIQLKNELLRKENHNEANNIITQKLNELKKIAGENSMLLRDIEKITLNMKDSNCKGLVAIITSSKLI